MLIYKSGKSKDALRAKIFIFRKTRRIFSISHIRQPHDTQFCFEWLIGGFETYNSVKKRRGRNTRPLSYPINGNMRIRYSLLRRAFPYLIYYTIRAKFLVNVNAICFQPIPKSEDCFIGTLAGYVYSEIFLIIFCNSVGEEVKKRRIFEKCTLIFYILGK